MSALNNNTTHILDLPHSIYTDELPNHLSTQDTFNFFLTCKTLWNSGAFWHAVVRSLGGKNMGPNNHSWATKTISWLQFQRSEIEKEKRIKNKNAPIGQAEILDPGYKKFKKLFKPNFFLRIFKPEAPLSASLPQVLYLQQQHLYGYFDRALKQISGRQIFDPASSVTNTFVSDLKKENLTVLRLHEINCYLQAENTCVIWSILIGNCKETLPSVDKALQRRSTEDVISVAPRFDHWINTHMKKLLTSQKASLPGLSLKFLPLPLFKLTNLKVLSLESNELYTLPEEISNLINLEELVLTNNQFCEFPEEILKIKTLRLLNMACNPLKNIPLGFKDLSALKRFSVYEHRIKFLPEGFTWPPLLQNPPYIPIKTKLTGLSRITTFLN